MVGPAAKREAVAHLQATSWACRSVRACSSVGADRKMIRYRSCRPPETELRGKLRDLGRFVQAELALPTATPPRRLHNDRLAIGEAELLPSKDERF